MNKLHVNSMVCERAFVCFEMKQTVLAFRNSITATRSFICFLYEGIQLDIWTPALNHRRRRRNETFCFVFFLLCFFFLRRINYINVALRHWWKKKTLRLLAYSYPK